MNACKYNAINHLHQTFRETKFKQQGEPVILKKWKRTRYERKYLMVFVHYE